MLVQAIRFTIAEYQCLANLGILDMQVRGNYAQRRYVLAHQAIAFTIFPELDLQLEISKVLPKI